MTEQSTHKGEPQSGESRREDLGSFWQRLRRRLEEHGIFVGINRLDDLDLSDLENLDFSCDLGGRRGVKVVCVSPDLKESVEEMGATQRDQVVMVRVDEGTREQLDAWVATGAVKSRSEAAALFIREGRSVSLTTDGEALLGYARRLLRLNREAVSRFVETPDRGLVKLGAPEDFGSRYLPDILTRFAATCPLVEVDVVLRTSNELSSRFDSIAR